MATLRRLMQASFLLSRLATAAESAPAADEIPALIVQPTQESRAALQQLVGLALNRASVRIADDALTRESALAIEPVRVRDQLGRSVYDREIRVIEHFLLVQNGRACVLIRESTGERFALAHTQCVATP